MKIEEVPQDLKYYKGSIIRDITYAVDRQGRYCGVVSDGWDAKNEALKLALDEIELQCQDVLERIKNGESSPLEYHAVRNKMSLELLADYTGFSKRKVRKHCRPENFASLDEETLAVYADALQISVEELTSLPENTRDNGTEN